MELLIALTLLLLVALSFIPMFVFISEASQNNRVRLIAQKLASSRIEEIRALPYDQVGTIEGNPKGVIPQEEKVEIEGIEFTVKTRIWWVDDPSDNDASGDDPMPYDYKRVQVTVTSPSLFAGEVVKTADISTLVAMEGEDRVLDGGNLLVTVQRGWDQAVVEGMKIDLVDEDGAKKTGWTDDNGQVLFAGLEEGKYNVEPDVGISGMMVKPDAETEVNVIEGRKQTCDLEVEYPCFLEIKLVDRETKNPITDEAEITLTTSDMKLPSKRCKPDSDGVISSEKIGKLWPVRGNAYDVLVSVDGYFPYRLQNDPDPDQWDGTFNGPGEEKSITIGLTPASDTASVTVVDANNNKLEGATVKVYEHEFIYQEGNWVTLSYSQVASKTTDTNGTAVFALRDNYNVPKPTMPKEGDRYTSYSVSVSKVGFKDKEIDDAFWVINGKQMSTNGNEIETYTVQLESKRGGQLTVKVRIRVLFWFDDVSDADVRVEGPDPDDVLYGKTNSNGEAVFNNLIYDEEYKVTVSFDFWGLKTRTESITIKQGENYLQFDF